MYTSEFSIEKLKSFYTSQPAAKPVLDCFAARRNNEFVMTVDDLQAAFQKKQYPIQRQDIVNVFKGLKEIGCGEFKSGRRTQKSRFQSTISLARIGKAVFDGKTEGEGVDQFNQEPDEVQQKPEHDVETFEKIEGNKNSETREASAVEQAGLENLLIHSYVLRPNLTVGLKLPVNLTVSEAERLSGYIKTLPFNT